MKAMDFYMEFSNMEVKLEGLKKDPNATKSIKQKIDDAIEAISEIQGEIDC